MAIVRSRLTEEEFMRLPDDGRKYELVDGEAKEVPTGVKHDELVMHVGFLLHPFTRGQGALVASSAGFRMVSGNIRCPDVSFTRKSRLPGGESPVGFGDAAPDLCIEIISPSEDTRDAERKVREYFEAGALLVWHLYPGSEHARVFRSPEESILLGPDDEIDGGGVLPGFRCRVSDLFNLE